MVSRQAVKFVQRVIAIGICLPQDQHDQIISLIYIRKVQPDTQRLYSGRQINQPVKDQIELAGGYPVHKIFCGSFTQPDFDVLVRDVGKVVVIESQAVYASAAK
jgi:hypothetical protein